MNAESKSLDRIAKKRDHNKTDADMMTAPTSPNERKPMHQAEKFKG